MPIRLNLLAEAQAEEELRRRDPVKRAIWGGGLLVGCVLLYSGILLIQTFSGHSTLKRIEERQESQNAKYQLIADNEKRLADTLDKLRYLNQLAKNRLLLGNILNAMQSSTVEDVQLTHFRIDQTYNLTAEIKAKHDEASGRTTIGKPGYVTRNITLLFDAKDNSPTPGDQIEKYKSALTSAKFFGGDDTNTNGIVLKLKNLSAPTFDAESGKSAMFFSFECFFPEKIIK